MLVHCPTVPPGCVPISTTPYPKLKTNFVHTTRSQLTPTGRCCSSRCNMHVDIHDRHGVAPVSFGLRHGTRPCSRSKQLPYRPTQSGSVLHVPYMLLSDSGLDPLDLSQAVPISNKSLALLGLVRTANCLFAMGIADHTVAVHVSNRDTHQSKK